MVLNIKKYYYVKTSEEENAPMEKLIRPFTNQYLEVVDCSTLKQLTLMDVTNHTMLKTLNMSACDQLQKTLCSWY